MRLVDGPFTLYVLFSGPWTFNPSCPRLELPLQFHSTIVLPTALEAAVALYC